MNSNSIVGTGSPYSTAVATPLATGSVVLVPTRVAIVVPEALPGQGGIARVIAYQTRYMAAELPDIEFEIFRSRYEGGPLARHLSTPLALLAFGVGLLRQRIDVVHINVAPRGSTWRKMLYAALARGLGRKVVLHLHGSGYDQFYARLPRRAQLMVRDFFGRADKVVSLSRFWTRFVAHDLGVPEARIVEIPNGVPAAASPVRPDHDGPSTILFLGAVGHRKGIDVLIDALAELRRRGAAFRAVIGGSGEVEQAQARAAELGISDAMTFLGWIDETEVGRQLERADIFVLPSRAENQPVSILEAMARAIPVVSTTIGAIPEQVVEGATGLLVPPGEALLLADALQRLLEAPLLRRAMGEAGLRRFEAEYSVATSAERLAGLYRGLKPLTAPAQR